MAFGIKAVGGKALGYMVETGPGGTREADTFTCQHQMSGCRGVVAVQPYGMNNLSWCKKCGGLVCENPACHFRCDPVEAKLERQEKIARSDAGREAIERAIERAAAVQSYGA